MFQSVAGVRSLIPETTIGCFRKAGWGKYVGLRIQPKTPYITSIEKTVRATKKMTPDQLDEYGYVEFEKLERTYGPALGEKLRAAGRMVEVLEKTKPGLKYLLRSKGLGDNAMVASLLIQQSERYWARARGANRPREWGVARFRTRADEPSTPMLTRSRPRCCGGWGCHFFPSRVLLGQP